ncbi:hypothetical protein H4S08_004504 [Coemansia sp. RSA 1365]|nr:hypothetical protein H4S08_004504 [Coemansia sp. RSA 1365]
MRTIAILGKLALPFFSATRFAIITFLSIVGVYCYTTHGQKWLTFTALFDWTIASAATPPPTPAPADNLMQVVSEWFLSAINHPMIAQWFGLQPPTPKVVLVHSQELVLMDYYHAIVFGVIGGIVFELLSISADICLSVVHASEYLEPPTNELSNTQALEALRAKVDFLSKELELQGEQLTLQREKLFSQQERLNKFGRERFNDLDKIETLVHDNRVLCAQMHSINQPQPQPQSQSQPRLKSSVVSLETLLNNDYDSDSDMLM